MSPTGSPGEEARNEERHPDTQMAYGTQVVHQSQTPSKTTRHGTEPTHGVTGDNTEMADRLLGLLKQSAAPSKSVLTNEQPGIDVGGVPSGPRAMRENLPSSGHSSVSNIFPSPAAHTDALKAPSTGGFARTSTSRTSNAGLAPPADRMQSTRLPPSYPRDNASDKPTVSVTTNSALEDLEPDWVKDTCRADGCGRVPGPQQKLLSSWQKQRAGTNNRFPHANVPIHLFNAFKQFKLNAASSDSESSDEEGNPASTNHSSAEENVADGGTEDRTDSITHLLAKETDDLADEEDDLTSWSNSPAAESPKAPFRPGPTLPPDSSLPDQSTASQGEPQETSPVQEAQRVAVFQSSGEETTSGPRSSLPLVPDGDDSDGDMEMYLPRGLEDGNLGRIILPAATATDRAAIVLVKETPYPKEKNPASPPNVIFAAQAQQQSSSGTSKDTSSTSIVFGTYHEPSSSTKSVSGDTDAVPLQSIALVSSYNGHEENVEPVDARMEDANDAPPQPSPGFEGERQHANPAVSPSNPLGDLVSSLEPEQPRVEDGIPPLVSPGSSPMSGQRSHSEPESNGIAHAKRKFEHSPSKPTRGPSKRGKFIRYSGFPDKERGVLAELEETRKADFEEFAQRERTASLASNIPDNSAEPGAQPASSQSPQETNRGSKNGFEDLRTRSIIDIDAVERDGLAATGHQDVGIDQTHQQSHGSSPRSTAGEAEPMVPVSGTVNINQSRMPSPTPATELPEDVDMDIDDAEADDSDIETTRIESADADEIISGHAMRGHDGSHHVQGRSRTSDTPSKPAPRAATPKDVRPDMPSSKSEPIFEMFKATYPAYTGDVRHFLGQCKQMEKLDEQDKMVPKWQWDDFIIRNRTDYREYANQCLDNGEDAEPYYRFYKDNIRDTLYTEAIIRSRKTLAAAIGELEGGTAAKATATNVKDTVAKIFKSPSSTRSSRTESFVAKSSTIKPPTARVPITRAPGRSQAAVEGSIPVADIQRKPRQSLPPAFNNKSGVDTSTVQRPSKERPRQSLQASSSRGLSSLPSSNSLHHSTPAKQSNGLPTSHSTSTRRPSVQRTSSGSRVSTEPTGDPYRDFVFAMGRAKSFTGSDSVDSDAQKKWPENLHVRPVAETKRRGYDVL
ncbi:hypothetical protein P171DRAFT_476072, partial [Karstenula rhodostoma CBS 690.94]